MISIGFDCWLKIEEYMIYANSGVPGVFQLGVFSFRKVIL